MIVFPNAKINIGLRVVAKRPDGYHNLETVFFPVRLCDALEMAVTGETTLSVSGMSIDCSPDDNLILKAYHLLKKDFGLPPVKFHVHKVIPSGAGLGGGSSDAAFTLKMLNDYFDLNLGKQRLKQYAIELGADCPFFIEDIPMIAYGKGEKLYPIGIDLSKYQIVVVKPSFPVSTVEAFSNIIPGKSLFDLKKLPDLPINEWKRFVINDFEKTVFPKYPEIKKWKDILYDAGALFASMSGSGSAVFGIFTELPANIYNKIPKSILLIP